jgi:hypothetical protein
MVVHRDSFSSGGHVNTVNVTDTGWLVEGESIARLTGVFFRHQFDSVARAYHRTDTAPFAVPIVDFNLIPSTVLCYR